MDRTTLYYKRKHKIGNQRRLKRRISPNRNYDVILVIHRLSSDPAGGAWSSYYIGPGHLW